MWETLIRLLDTQAALALIASGVATALVVWMKKKPEIERYNGLLIAACKWAEKTIPDGTANKSMARFDAALKHFIVRYEELTGKTASAALKEAAAVELEVVHDQLEVEGTLA